METYIHYKYINNNNEITIVLLHGWGQNIQMMEPISKYYDKKYNILSVDLPGFGNSNDPKFVWTVYDYAEAINLLIKKLYIKKIFMIGHSFGGKIALIYASKYDVYKLVCFASPYCKNLEKISYKTKFYKKIKKYKLLNPISKIIENLIGSTDYKNANYIMRGILVNSININIIEDIKKIKCPTLLIWGSLDTAVPLYRAYELKKLIKESEVIVYENKTHYAYLEDIKKTIKILDVFIEYER